MPNHLSSNHFSDTDFVNIGGVNFIKGELIAWLDNKDSKYKRNIIYENAMVMQEWNGSAWVNV